MTDSQGNKMDVPIGAEMLRMVRLIAANTENQSEQMLNGADQQSHRIIGTALSALYQAATCHRKCYRGSHIFEALCGRAFNLGSSAYLVARFGYYDEASNLIRSIGELGNLISLSVVDKDVFKKWLHSDKQTRLRDFTPAKIRSALGKKGGIQIADADWYSRFCESFTHVTPDTKPNAHNRSGQGYVGGIFQPEGLRTTLGELATVLSVTAMFASAYAKFDDLLAEFYSFTDDLENTGGAERAL